MPIITTEFTRLVKYAVGPTASAGPFDIPFPFYDDDTVNVMVDGVPEANFTITKASELSIEGNFVTLDVAVSNATVMIYSDTGIVRTTGDTFSQADLSKEVDRLLALFQEFEEDRASSLRLPLGEAVNRFTPEDGKLIYWDETERTFKVGPDATNILSTTADVAAAEAARDLAIAAQAAAETAQSDAETAQAAAEALATLLNIDQDVSTAGSPTFVGLITGLVQILSHSAGTADAILLTNWNGEASRIAAERSLTLAADYNNNSNSAQSRIIFETDGIERATLSSHGRLGIGTSSPLQVLHVVGASIFQGNVAVGTTDFSADLGYTNRLKIGGTGPALVLEEDDTSQRWALAALNSDLVLRDGTTPGPIIVVKGGMNGQPLELNADGFVEFLQGYKETVHTVSGTTPALDPINGTIQVWTLTANSTPTDSIGAGESLTLMIDDGSAYTVTWPTMTWVNNGGSAPTLATSGYTTVTLWKVGSTLYGALVGDGS